jgi:REP element-mobilizing transposase RayT
VAAAFGADRAGEYLSLSNGFVWPPHLALIAERRRISVQNDEDIGLSSTKFWLSYNFTLYAFAMPQSLSFLLVHVVFSTRDRADSIASEVRPALFGYLATVARNRDCECYRVGGVADHVHLAIRISRTISVADLVEDLKTSSSKWMKTQLPQLTDFAWQRGYGAFSVGPADLEALVQYIEGQEEHHRTRTFQEEYRAFLTRYGVVFDERYLWD